MLLIPYEEIGPGFDARTREVLRLLEGSHKVIGARRKPTMNLSDFAQHLLWFVYSARVILFGIRHRREFDIICCGTTVHATTGRVLSFLTKKPYVFWGEDTLRWAWAKGRSSPYVRLLEAVDRFAYGGCAAMVLMSPDVRQVWADRGFDTSKVVIIPLLSQPGQTAASSPPQKQQSRRELGIVDSEVALVFAGNMRNHPPNESAAAWIVSTLATRLEREVPEFTIYLIGPHEDLPPVHPRARFVGYVEPATLLGYLRAADVSLAPVWDSTGVPHKVLDSMSSGTATVAPAWMKGHYPELEDGRDIVLAANPEEFAEKVVHLVKDPVGRERIAAQGRAFVQQHLRPERWRGKVDEILRQAVSGAG